VSSPWNANAKPISVATRAEVKCSTRQYLARDKAKQSEAVLQRTAVLQCRQSRLAGMVGSYTVFRQFLFHENVFSGMFMCIFSTTILLPAFIRSYINVSDWMDGRNVCKLWLGIIIVGFFH
jgi:hypothetical protein